MAASAPPNPTYSDYTIGWVCAIQTELKAATVMLDHRHSPLPAIPGDDNIYTLGKIGECNVVIACLPAGMTGKSSAASVAAKMTMSFPMIKFGLMVGIGRGAPSKKHDIRLGDVVVSKPEGIHGGVFQLDFGKDLPTGFEPLSILDKPPKVLLGALQNVLVRYEVEGSHSISDSMERFDHLNLTKYLDPGAEYDILFEADYEHVKDSNENCHKCSRGKEVKRIPYRRPASSPTEVKIHAGTIASGDRVMRYGKLRDDWARKYNVLCFEMEAAGLMDEFPCLVIRGICDYADDHKNKKWQSYAAATAAAFAKDLLLAIPARQTIESPTVLDIWTPYLKEAPPLISAKSGFIGRQQELKALCEHFSTGSTSGISTVAVYGYSGMGKTQLVCKYAMDQKQAYCRAFFIRATDVSNTISDYRAIPGLSAQSNTEVRNWLEALSLDSHRPWLLIVDNVTEASFRLVREILFKTDVLEDPRPDRGHIIFATVSAECAEQLGGHRHLSIHLGAMASNESANLFNSIYQISSESSAYSNLIEEIVAEFDNFPIAVQHIAHYMKSHRIDPQSFRIRLKDVSYKISVLSAKTLSLETKLLGEIVKSGFEHLNASDSIDLEIQQDILVILALFDNQKISVDILQSIAAFSKKPRWMTPEVILRLRSVCKVLGNQNESILLPMLEHFAAVGLIQKSGQILSIHNIFQDFILKYAENRVPEILQCAMLAMINALHGKLPDDPVAWNLYESCLPHFRSLIKYRGIYLKQVPCPEFAGFVYQAAEYLCYIGQSYSALDLYGNALSDFKRAGMKGNELGTDEAYGWALLGHGRYAKAREKFGHVYRERVRLFGENHKDAKGARRNIARVLQLEGQLEAAENEYRRLLSSLQTETSDNASALGIGRKVRALRSISGIASYFGHSKRSNEWPQEESSKDLIMASTYEKEGLALIVRERGYFEHSVKLLEEVLRAKETHAAEGNLDDIKEILHTRQNTAISRMELGFYFEVESEYQKLLIHPVTDQVFKFSVNLNLGFLYVEEGSYDKALAIFRRLEHECKERCITDHELVQLVQQGLGYSYWYLDQSSQSPEIFENLLRKYDELHMNPNVTPISKIRTLEGRAMCWGSLERCEEAIDEFSKVIEMKTKVLGKDHPETCTTYHRFALFYLHKSDTEEASKWFEKALQGRRKSLSEKHPGTRDSKRCLENIMKSVPD